VVWIVCFYLPAANLIPIYPAIADWALFTPEHNLYVPLAGLALLAGCGADVLWSGTPARESIGARHLVLAPRYGRVLQPIAAAVLLALAARTALRVLDWRDELTLFRSAAAAGSRSPRVHFNLGNLQLARGDLAAAAASFETAVRWEPRDGQAWGNLAVVRQRRGDVEGALAAYSNSLRLRPGAPAVWENLASLHIARGDLAAARRSLTAALRLDPTRAEARRALEALARLPER
jgi:tetratricopeptide (TPR) repeat protein